MEATSRLPSLLGVRSTFLPERKVHEVTKIIWPQCNLNPHPPDYPTAALPARRKQIICRYRYILKSCICFCFLETWLTDMAMLPGSHVFPPLGPLASRHDKPKIQQDSWFLALVPGGDTSSRSNCMSHQRRPQKSPEIRHFPYIWGAQSWHLNLFGHVQNGP